MPDMQIELTLALLSGKRPFALSRLVPGKSLTIEIDSADYGQNPISAVVALQRRFRTLTGRSACA